MQFGYTRKVFGYFISVCVSLLTVKIKSKCTGNKREDKESASTLTKLIHDLNILYQTVEIVWNVYGNALFIISANETVIPA
jgi:hypothetical protein